MVSRRLPVTHRCCCVDHLFLRDVVASIICPSQVLLRRVGGSFAFHGRRWKDYVNGFKDATGDQFWAGLETAYRVTKDNSMTLHVNITSPKGKFGTIKYADFRVLSAVLRYGLRYSHVVSSQKTGESGDE